MFSDVILMKLSVCGINLLWWGRQTLPIDVLVCVRKIQYFAFNFALMFHYDYDLHEL